MAVRTLPYHSRALWLVAAAFAVNGCVTGHRAASRPIPPSARRVQIFARTLVAQEAPEYVILDANSVYRLEFDSGVVSLSPRLLHQPPPLYRSPLFGAGVMVLPAVSGEYRVDAITTTPVRIFREEYDNVELECFRQPGGRACRELRHGRMGRRWGVYLAVVAIPVAYWMWTRE